MTPSSVIRNKFRYTRSRISKQVAALEEKTGVRLFDRTTRRVSLTEGGQLYLERCQWILKELETADSALDQIRDEPRGRLRLSAPLTFGLLHIAPTLPEFLHQHPQIQVDLSLNDRHVDLIEEGFDLAIRIGNLPDSSFRARKLATDRRVVCGSPDYFRQHLPPQTPADLEQHNCLTYSYAARNDIWQFSGPDGDFQVHVKGNLRVNNGDTLRLAALAGLGLIQVPTFMVGGDLQMGRLRSILTEYGGDRVTIQALYPGGRHTPSKVRAFINFLAQRIGKRPDWYLTD
ncbi:MAG: LysR family transcriptional regulator [Magnetococcales bacterium]|nr:LysR family transcriptional regulator [Magnetococcales bacterium]